MKVQACITIIVEYDDAEPPETIQGKLKTSAQRAMSHGLLISADSATPLKARVVKSDVDVTAQVVR